MGASALPIAVFTILWGVVGIVCPFFAPKGPNRGIIQVVLMLTAATCWLFAGKVIFIRSEMVEDVQHLLMECVWTCFKREQLCRVWGYPLWDVGFFQSIFAEPASNPASWLCAYMAQMNPLIGPRLTNETLIWIARKWGNSLNLTEGH